MTYYIFNENVISKDCASGSTTTFNVGGKTISVVGASDGKAYLNISPFLRAKFGNKNTNGDALFMTSLSLSIEGTTHTIIYGYCAPDETPFSGAHTTMYSNTSVAGENQILVRWLDHFGTWRYWVFEKGATSIQDAQTGETMYGLTSTQAFSRPQAKTNAESINICAPLLERDVWLFLADLKKSVNVCAKFGSSWLPVVVSTGATTWARDKRQILQDFEAVITKPENRVEL